MLSLITSLWSQNPTTSTKLEDACDEHIAEKGKERELLQQKVNSAKERLEACCAITEACAAAHDESERRRKSFLRATSASLQSVRRAVEEAREDADALEQTLLLLQSFSVEEYRASLSSMDETSLRCSKALSDAQAEQATCAQNLRLLEDDLATIDSHIREVEQIRIQLCNSKPKSHSD